MNISSLLQSGMYNINSTNSSTNSSQSTQAQSELLKLFSEGQDSISFSSEGMARSKMPPPEKIDFSEMSDEDLVNFLQQIQERTGSIPGVDEGTSVSDLTTEQLQGIREQLTEMSSKMEEMRGMHGMGGMRGMGGMGGPPPMDVQSMSKDDLISLLQDIQEKTGSVPGVDDSESTDVSSLNDEQLQSARDALTEMMKERMEKMSQNMAMTQGISAYASTGVQL